MSSGDIYDYLWGMADKLAQQTGTDVTCVARQFTGRDGNSRVTECSNINGLVLKQSQKLPPAERSPVTSQKIISRRTPTTDEVIIERNSSPVRRRHTPVSRERTSPERTSIERISRERITPERISPERTSGERLSRRESPVISRRTISSSPVRYKGVQSRSAGPVLGDNGTEEEIEILETLVE